MKYERSVWYRIGEFVAGSITSIEGLVVLIVCLATVVTFTTCTGS
jgi:hypothetical protein